MYDSHLSDLQPPCGRVMGCYILNLNTVTVVTRIQTTA